MELLHRAVITSVILPGRGQKDYMALVSYLVIVGSHSNLQVIAIDCESRNQLLTSCMKFGMEDMSPKPFFRDM